MAGDLIVTHKVKPILCQYCHERWSRWKNGCHLYAGISYICENVVCSSEVLLTTNRPHYSMRL